jgi:hypothetical protein
MPISEASALERLKGRGFIPKSRFPGAASRPWRLKCEICSKLVTETLVSLEKRSRPGCKSCCSVSQNRITAGEASKRLRQKRLVPLEDFPGTVNAKWKVRCLICGVSSATSLSDLATRKNDGCSQCGLNANYQKNTVEPRVAIARARKAGLKPLSPYPGNSKERWRCLCQKCGSEVSPTLNQISMGSPCAECGIQRGISKRRTPEQLAVARMIQGKARPLEPYPGADKPWLAECLKCKRQIRPRLSGLKTQGACRFCAIDEISRSKLSRSLPKSKLQMKVSGFEPIGEFRGFTRPWTARCLKCGEISSPAPQWLAEGSGCRWCAKNAPWTDSQVRKIAKLAKREFVEPFSRASHPTLMKCLSCGSSSRVKPSTLLGSKGFCQSCKPSAEWTPDKAVQVLAAARMEPLEPFKSATTSWKSKCQICGTIGTPKLTNIASGQGGCKVCGNFGFDVNKPTTLYVLYNQKLGVIKVGITNTGSTRLRSLAGVGFVPGKLYLFDQGSEPLRVETLLLRFIKKELGLKPALRKTDMRGVGGATETFWRDELKPNVIHSRIRALRDPEIRIL